LKKSKGVVEVFSYLLISVKITSKKVPLLIYLSDVAFYKNR